MLTLGILGNIFTHGLKGLFLMLDSLVFWIVSQVYELFYSLATNEFITTGVYEEIANRFLVVLGVAMLFYLAYALLKALVNPDELNKTTSKIVVNLITSLVLIVVAPTIFTYCFRIQNILIEDHVIDRLVFGNTETSLDKVGRATAMTFFEAFAEIPEDLATTEDLGRSKYNTWGGDKDHSLRRAIIENEDGVSFLDVTYLADLFDDYPDETSYKPIVGTLCGIFLIYVIFSFCLDLGIRVVKLAFYQIISPIPIMMRIIPEKKSVFDNWIKATLATYLEVFVRIFIMYLISFLASQIIDGVINMENFGFLGKLIVLMGIFAFAKQAPKLISDMIGIKSGDIKLGIRKKLAEGGAYIPMAAIGGGIKAGVNNFTHGYINMKNGNGTFKEAVASMGAGFVSGSIRSGNKALKSQNFKDMRDAANQGAGEAMEARDRRESYRANHGDSTLESMSGHISDMSKAIASWAGVITPLEQLNREKKKVQEISDARKELNDKLKSIMELQAMKRYASKGQKIGGLVEEYEVEDEDGNKVKKTRSIEKNYTNLAELRNDIEKAKATGKTFDGYSVDNATLVKMQAAEEELKKRLQKDILRGYDTDGATIDMDKYRGDLKEAVEKYRTVAYKNLNTVSQNIDPANTKAVDGLADMKASLEHVTDNINDFIGGVDGFANQLFDGGFHSLNNANSNLGQKITTSIQKEQNNSGNKK